MKSYELVTVHGVKCPPEYVLNIDINDVDIETIKSYLDSEYKLIRLIVIPKKLDAFDDPKSIPDLKVIQDKLHQLLPKYYNKLEVIGLPICCSYPYHNDLMVSPTKPSIKFKGAWYSQYPKCKDCIFSSKCIGVPESYKQSWNKKISPIKDDYQELKCEWR